MTSVDEAVAWLETSKNSKSPSLSKVYATIILGELSSMRESLDVCATELEERERLWAEERDAHAARQYEFDVLEQKAIAARDEWDIARAELEAKLREKEAE